VITKDVMELDGIEVPFALGFNITSGAGTSAAHLD
jgi:hypothetical protein